PYNNVAWRSPYSANYQMGGAPGLYINPSSGEVSITPNTEGQFVVGITVKEYRNGQLVGETRRDYQINVIECVFDIVADYTIDGGTAVAGRYTFECRDTVFFKNRSYSKEPATYFWDFGDPTTTDDTSSLENPFWVYPGNGDYDVTLTVKSSICEDDYQYGVRIRSSKPFELGPDLVFCDEFTQRLSTEAPDAITTLWNTGETSFTINAKDTGTYSVTISYGNCSYADTVHLAYNFLPPFEIPKDSLFCEVVDMIIDVGVSGLNYQWSTSLADTNQSVRVTEAGTYTVYVDNGDCYEQQSIRLWQASSPLVEDTFYCGEFDHPVSVGSFEEGEYLWSNNSTNQATSYTTGGNHWVQVKQRHCISIDSFFILNPVINLELGPDEHFCDFVNKELDAGEDGVTFDWSSDQSDRVITAIAPGIYSVVVTDQYGCTAEDTITLTMSNSPTFELGDDTTICLRSPTTLEAPEGYTAYEWNTGQLERAIIVEQQGEYIATITDGFGCTGTDTLFVTVDPDALPNDLYIANAFSPNADNLNDLFPFQEVITQPGYYVAIFSRWGEKVFDSRTSDSQNWDGFYKGEKVPNQTFIYYIYFRGCDGNARTKKGTVNPLY
ncbi:MAG: gliding motility-associated C-terminal domain-containing protein, partial [Bacteroidia bacterium]|nr:gliding motility-associated C-terminal domain-containing protein [Bacteroidia bacterium]